MDSTMHIIAGLPGPVPGTMFDADKDENTHHSRLLFTPGLDDNGMGAYIMQSLDVVVAGIYYEADTQLFAMRCFMEPAYQRTLRSTDEATRHVGDVAVALTDGGFDLLHTMFPREE